jgi:acyl carrier protein
VYILDRHLQPVPVGVPGELCTGGDGVARGYLNRPELTAEKFIDIALPHDDQSNIPGPTSRIYKTGDLARWRPDGTIEFLGRIDQQVKIRGFRVEPGEIEAVLKQHPAVREVAVIAREDQPGVKKLVAYVTVQDAGRGMGDAADVSSIPRPASLPAALREFLKSRLPDYMIPAAFVELAALPLNANGKVDRKALPAPDQAREETDAGYVAPRSATERFLAGIWQEVLGIERISVHDNFFELGGDSLQAAVLTNRIQEELQVTAHVRALFMAPNIADLARYVEEYYPEAARRLGDDPAGAIAAPAAIISGGAGAGQVDEHKIAQIRAIIPPLRGRPAGLAGTAKNPPAIFVLSPPRSGSTLLRTMLAGHSRLFAPPELDLLSFNTLAERRAAFSGEHSFWLEGAIRALMEVMGVDAEQAAAVMAGYEADGMTVKAFYGQLQAALGARRLVDKTPVYPLDPAILRRMEEDFERPAYIHLVRHPHASIYSFMEAKLDHIFFRHPHPFAQRELAELVWIICHEHILAFLRDIPPERQCRITFEELVSQPAAEIQRLCAFLDIPFEESMLKPYEGRRMTDGIRPGAQMVGDFKFYLRSDIDPRAANRWQQFHAEEFLSPISRRIAMEIGYMVPVAVPAAPARGELLPLQPAPA